MHNFLECAMCVLRLEILCGVVSPCNFIYHSRFSLYFVCGDRPTVFDCNFSIYFSFPCPLFMSGYNISSHCAFFQLCYVVILFNIVFFQLLGENVYWSKFCALWSRPFLVNELEPQHLLHDRRKVYEVGGCLLLFSFFWLCSNCFVFRFHDISPCLH